MSEIFTWRALVDTSGGGDYTVSRSQFGDGYRQTVKLGINNKTAKFNVSVSGYRNEMKAVIAFLDLHGGAIPFLWKAPMEDVRTLWTCPGYRASDQGGAYFTITMEFERYFAP